jgi:hypothetical protein
MFQIKVADKKILCSAAVVFENYTVYDNVEK